MQPRVMRQKSPNKQNGNEKQQPRPRNLFTYVQPRQKLFRRPPWTEGFRLQLLHQLAQMKLSSMFYLILTL